MYLPSGLLSRELDARATTNVGDPRKRNPDLAQNQAGVFSIRTTEMKMTIDQMHFVKHQAVPAENTTVFREN